MSRQGRNALLTLIGSRLDVIIFPGFAIKREL